MIKKIFSSKKLSEIEIQLFPGFVVARGGFYPFATPNT